MKKQRTLLIAACVAAGMLIMGQTMDVNAEDSASSNTLSKNMVSENAVSENTASMDAASENQTNMKVGDSKRLQAQVSENTVTISENEPLYVWSSSDEEVATVDETGAIRMTGGGSATIICTNRETGEVVSEADIDVVLEISISDNAVSDNAVSDNAVSDNAVSDNAVSDNAVSDNAVSDNAVSANAVSEDTVSEEAVSKNAVSTNAAGGNTADTSAVSENTVSGNKDVVWSSSKKTVAYADKEGKVKLTGTGKATVQGKLDDGIHATLKADIRVKKLTRMKQEPRNTDIIWTSSDPSIASVDENGNVTAVSAGTVYIVAVSMADGHPCSCEQLVIAD